MKTEMEVLTLFGECVIFGARVHKMLAEESDQERLDTLRKVHNQLVLAADVLSSVIGGPIGAGAYDEAIVAGRSRFEEEFGKALRRFFQTDVGGAQELGGFLARVVAGRN